MFEQVMMGNTVINDSEHKLRRFSLSRSEYGKRSRLSLRLGWLSKLTTPAWKQDSHLVSQCPCAAG